MTTRDKVIELRKQNRRIKGAEMARLLGVTREYIRQVLVDIGEPTAFYKGRKCCKVCGKRLYRDNITGLCWKHWKMRKHAQGNILLVCPECKKSILLKKSQVKARLARNKMIFCSSSCSSKWFWRDKSKV